ncbi:Fatty acyl-CoA reductase [compost metagenome]
MFRRLLESVLFPHKKINKTKLNNAINGKTIVVTGASFGIGSELCLLLSHYNVHLVLVARTRSVMEELAQKIEANGSTAAIITADLYDDEQIDQTINQLLQLERIDFFISNAGKSIMRSLARSLDRFHDITRTNTLNYLTPAKMILALTPLLAKSKGTVINVSSMIVLLLPAPMWCAYQASKTAFDNWFRGNWAEWKHMGITAKSIYYPLVKTRMIAPNPKYANALAMEADQAAIRICRLIYRNKPAEKPWWGVAPQAASFFGKRLWNKYSYVKVSSKG